MILFLISILFLILFYLNSKRLSLLFGLYKKGINDTPLIGGLGIYISFIISLTYFFIIDNELISRNILIIITISLIFFVGLIDDIFNLNYKIRLLSIFTILIVFLYLNNNFLISNLYFESLNVTFVIGNASYIITPLFIVLLLNSMNMVDGINGNSGLIFLSYCMMFYYIGEENNKNIIILLFIIIPIIIFLIFNMKNKLYLGDSGVYLLSSIIAFYAIDLYNFNTTNISSEKLFLIFMIPGLDMFRVFCLRIINKKNPFKGDLNHIQNLLINRFSNIKSLIITMAIIIWPTICYKITNVNVEYLIIANTLIYIFLIMHLIKLKNFSEQFKNNK